MGQIIRSLMSSLFVCLSVVSRSQFLTNFDDIWHRHQGNLIQKNFFVAVNIQYGYHPIFTPFPPKLAST